MNPQSPDSSEDRMLDELLRVQSHGPDEVFLKQIESAIDAGARPVAQQTAKGNFSRAVIAASVLLAAGSGIWWWYPDRAEAPLGVGSLEMKTFLPESTKSEIIPGGTKKDISSANPNQSRETLVTPAMQPEPKLPESESFSELGPIMKPSPSGVIGRGSAGTGPEQNVGAGAGATAASSQATADASDLVDGANVRIIRHQDGTRSIFTRNPEGTTIIKKTFSASGILAMKTTYKLDKEGNPLGCKIVDGQNNELFKVSYGYHKTTGRLVSELMFDSRVRRIDPKTGKETPVQEVTYSYDDAGERGKPVIYNYLPGGSIEQTLGNVVTFLENDLFTKPGETRGMLGK